MVETFAVPTIVPYTVDDYAAQLQAHLPRGRVWPRDPTATQTLVMQALVPTTARLELDAIRLLSDIYPATSVGLLTEWEATLGLPDPCAGPAPTIVARQAQVTARFIFTGGASVAYFIAFAAALGYPGVTIGQFAPARCGHFTAGDRIYGNAWAFAWTISSPALVITYAVAGGLRAGEPLATWGSTVLLCEIQRIAPAHTLPLFDYTGTPSTIPFTIAVSPLGRDALI